MLTVLVFILILGLLVLVHEIGHFVSALRLGVDVEEFGLGFPPRLISFKRKGIRYSLNLLPLGGFVKIKGESGGDNEDPHNFFLQPVWKKSIILSAGVTMNFLLAWLLLAFGFYHGLPQAIESGSTENGLTERRVLIMEVVKNSPALQAGLGVGDEILSINNVKITNSEEVYNLIETSTTTEVAIGYVREGQTKETKIKPEIIDNSSEFLIGIGVIDTAVVHYGFWGSLGQGLKTTVILTWQILVALYNLLAKLLTEGKLMAEISGPVGVAAMTGKFVKMGWIFILQFAALLSINLAIINILPFPALDGGRLAFVFLEKIRGHRVSEKIENIIHNSGFVLLMLLIVVITFRDLGRYGGSILGFFRNLF
jgi:regulator of sigma E protease